jgi:Anti-sigma-K factor rskA, C-terminal
MTDDEMVAYLAGDAETLPAGADSSQVERTRALLGDPDLWAEPSPELEQRVIDAVLGGPRPVRRAPRHWLRNSLVAAAAAVVLAIGLATVISNDRSRPVEFAATLQGTELAPAATGSVTMTQTVSGWRIHLRASGLPRLDGGSYYQGWLKNDAGTLVPIGTFNQATDVTLWAGVPPSDYPTITITRQSATSGPASSGQKVLLGTTHRTH